MKKILLFLVFSYLYFDGYLSCNYMVYPVMKSAQSRAGIYLSFPYKLDDCTVIPFLDNETYMTGIGCPIQINYIAGIKIDFGNIEIQLYHECQHPIQVDIQSNNRNSVGIKYIF